MIVFKLIPLECGLDQMANLADVRDTDAPVLPDAFCVVAFE